eukprot:TRINITY_DN1324_c0_g1_i4.p4 TRINITY_DN1324_c0_g1~~TRINITY_DN1324_c0_g1_i4.p4  ORF type:complete len:112 (-),score=7.26 TRINITY_DN1324_c0_g1_i4:1047-1382(-)
MVVVFQYAQRKAMQRRCQQNSNFHSKNASKSNQDKKSSQDKSKKDNKKFQDLLYAQEHSKQGQPDDEAQFHDDPTCENLNVLFKYSHNTYTKCGEGLSPSNQVPSYYPRQK